MEDLEDKILRFIDTKREDEIWDFKEKWSGKDKKSDLLHDIIVWLIIQIMQMLI